MSWNQAWDIGQIAGIRLRAHFSFALLLGLSGLLGLASAGPAGLVMEVTFIALLFGLVLAHELGHALAARSFGIPTREIMLLPVGGVARMDRQPATPYQEILVALAGPAVNMAAATALLPLVYGSLGTGGLFEQLLWANVGLALFNLIPAFPMDGGRVLRAVLSLSHGPLTATRLAARIGQGSAVAMGLYGILFQPFLVLVAVFVWYLASSELARLPLEPVWERVLPGEEPRRRPASLRTETRLYYHPGRGWRVFQRDN